MERKRMPGLNGALVFLAACLVAAAAASATPRGAQGERPRISPHETTESVVDGNRMTIVYGRPSMRGRKIWGGLVRWGSTWTPGADEATLLTTARPIVIEGRAIPAGTYSLYVLVDPDRPQLILNTQTGQWHTVYTPSRDLVRVNLRREMLSAPVEQLTLAVDASSGGGGTLGISWDTTRYWVKFVVATAG
jgi:hypothetical protein